MKVRNLLITAFFTFLTLITLLFLFFPYYLENYLLPEVAAQKGIPGFRLHIDMIGLNEIRISDVAVGSPEKRTFSADSITVHYNPLLLLKAQIEDVVINGTNLHVLVKDGSLSLAGLPSETQILHDNRKTSIQDIQAIISQLPIQIGKITLRNSYLTVEGFNYPVIIPFKSDFEILDNKKGSVNGMISLLWEGEYIDIHGTADISENHFFADIQSKKRHFHLPSPPLPSTNDFFLSCLATFDGKISGALLPFSPSYKAELFLENLFIHYNNFEITSEDFQHAITPSAISIDGIKNGFTVTISNLIMSKPYSAKLSDINISTKFSGAGDTTYGQLQYQSEIDNLEFSEKFSPDEEKSNNRKLSINNIAARGNITFTDLGNNPSFTGDLTLSGHAFTFLQNHAEFRGDFTLSGNGIYDLQNKIPQLMTTGTLHMTNGSVLIPDHNVEASGISADIPVRWPINQPDQARGVFTIQTIKNPEYDFGTVSGNIELADTQYHIASTYKSHIFEQFSAYLNGSINLSALSRPEAYFTFTAPQYSFQAGNAFLSSIAPDIDISGKIDATATIKANISGLSANAVVHLSDTHFAQPANNFAISGITLRIPFPDIALLKSGTSFLSYDSAQFGDMRLGGGKAYFQLESEKSLLIENSILNWAGGHVDIMGTRIKRNKEEQQITLYCDGLKLADILTQAGISSVSGDGRVNGKIPLIIANGRLSFENAFLYSTPGTGGSIHFKNSEILLAGIPQDTQQYSQLDFAGEALKNFNYRWVTLNLQSQGEDAVLAMKLNGKPATPLPFQYNVNSGLFVRLADGDKGIDYPIDLDVNFHLPLNKIVNYGKNLKDLF